jgi:hypothetical protein
MRTEDINTVRVYCELWTTWEKYRICYRIWGNWLYTITREDIDFKLSLNLSITFDEYISLQS